MDAAKNIADADRILIAAPFWDMSFPAVLKSFFEQTSLFEVTFTDNGKTCVGLCKSPKVLYITTRGMDIPTGSYLDQGTPYLRALGAAAMAVIAKSNGTFHQKHQGSDIQSNGNDNL